MEQLSLSALAEDLLADARSASSGRHARTVHGGHEHALRQTVLGLLAGHSLSEHLGPGEGTLHVLSGRIRLIGPADSWELAAGDFLVIPPVRNSVDALEDSVFLLSVAVHVASDA